jgi:tellurite resistance protein TehA-like permease
MKNKEQIYGLVKKTKEEYDKEVEKKTIIISLMFFSGMFLLALFTFFDDLKLVENFWLNNLYTLLIPILFISVCIFSIYVLCDVFSSKYKKVELKEKIK